MTTSSTPTPPAHVAWTHPAARPFAIMGAIAIIVGGFLSAVLAPVASYHGNWAVAYIVLVAGVAQIALGVGQATVLSGQIRSGAVITQLLLWNLGATATVIATVLDLSVLLYAAACAQIIVIISFLYLTRNGRKGRILLIVRVLSVILLISIPTGVVLQALTH